MSYKFCLVVLLNSKAFFYAVYCRLLSFSLVYRAKLVIMVLFCYICELLDIANIKRNYIVMGFSDLLKKMFGSKADRDLKEIRPILNKALAAYDRIDKMSDDQVREEAQRIKRVIAERIAEDESKKKQLRGQLEDLTLSPD